MLAGTCCLHVTRFCTYREYIKDMLAAFTPLIQSDGNSLGTHETLCTQLLSLQNLFGWGESRSVIAAATPYLVIEYLLQCVIALPQAPYMTAWLHRLILELQRVSPSTVRLVPCLRCVTCTASNLDCCLCECVFIGLSTGLSAYPSVCMLLHALRASCLIFRKHYS